MTTKCTHPFPLVLVPRPGTSAPEVAGLLRALPAMVTPVLLRLPPAGRHGQVSARALGDVVDVLAGQVTAAGIRGPFALYGWGPGAYLGLALATRYEVVTGHPVCTTLIVSDAPAPYWSAPSPGGTSWADRAALARAVRRTVTESRLVIGSTRAPGGHLGACLAPWSRNSTSGTDFVTLPDTASSSWPAAASRVVAARMPFSTPDPARAASAPVQA